MFLFLFYSSHGMFSTRCLIPLLTAGQQLNWDPPPGHGRGGGVHLDGTPLGASGSGVPHP